MTRRDFVAAAAATSSSLYALRPDLGWAAGSRLRGPFDVAIVGAGAAGIGAGRRVKAAGKKYVILEARNRIGGRTFTDTTSFPGITWDQGGQWLHFVTPSLTHPGTNNPLFNIARKKHKKVFPDLGPRILYAPPAPPVDLLESPALPIIAGVAIDVIGAGLAASIGAIPDVSVADATDFLSDQPWYDFVLGLVTAAIGGAAEDVSCLDLYNESRGGAVLPPIVPSFDNWLIPSGLGALVTSLAKGLHIHKGTVVRRIHWGGKDGVVLDTSHGKVRAKTVIVTVPIGTLASGTPEFTPDLPTSYSNAIEKKIKMGHTAKIALLFKDDFVFDVPEDNTFASPNIDQRDVPLVQTRAFGHENFAIVIASGNKIAELERDGKLVEYAREQIRVMFGQQAFDAFRAGVASSWNTSPYSLGAFSHVVPGGVPARRRLRRPIAHRIFFAGEATSIVQHSSASGAFTSGQDAARKALRALRRKRWAVAA